MRIIDEVGFVYSWFLFNNSRIVKQVLNEIQVDDTPPPFSGRFVKCNSTTHLTTFVTLKSSSVEKQVNNVVKVTRDLSEALQTFCEDCIDNQMSFLDHVLKHPNLPFATDDEENKNNLTAKTCANISATGKTFSRA
jgi:hypothetical protein